MRRLDGMSAVSCEVLKLYDSLSNGMAPGPAMEQSSTLRNRTEAIIFRIRYLFECPSGYDVCCLRIMMDKDRRE